MLVSFCSFFQALEDELSGRHAELMENCQVGEDLIKENHFGSPQIRERIDHVKDSWDRLQELAAARKKRLQEALDMYQVRLIDYGTKMVFSYSIQIDCKRYP